MAPDDALIERVRGALAPHDVVEKQMFGSLAFLLGGHMACGVREDTLFVRVGPDDYERALGETNVDAFPPSSTEYRAMRGFVTVEPAGIASDDDLVSWTDTGIAFVSTLKPKSGEG